MSNGLQIFSHFSNLWGNWLPFLKSNGSLKLNTIPKNEYELFFSYKIYISLCVSESYTLSSASKKTKIKV